MTRVHQVVVLAFIVFGVFTTATVSDSPTCKKGAQPVYQQQIIINSPDELSYPRATFDFTKVGEIVADELQNTTRWLAQMETNIAGKVHALSAELYAVKMQLDQITESVKELVELLVPSNHSPAQRSALTAKPSSSTNSSRTNMTEQQKDRKDRE